MPDRLRRRPAQNRTAFDPKRLQYEVGEELDERPKTTGPEMPGTKGRTPGIPDKDRDVKKS